MTDQKKIIRVYYPSGALRVESEINRLGTPDGVCREYFESGKLKSEQSRVNGFFHGRFRQWKEDGTLLGEFYCDHGTGCIREWYDTGQIKWEKAYVEGRSHGPEKLYDMTGKCCMTNYFYDNKKVSKKKYLELSQDKG